MGFELESPEGDPDESDFLNFATRSVGTDDLAEFLKFYAAEDGLPLIPLEPWLALSRQHKPEAQKKAFARHIAACKTPYPGDPPKEEEARAYFRRLCSTPWEEFIAGYFPDTKPFRARYDYRHWTDTNVLGVIPSGSQTRFNVVSDHFHWNNRHRCGGWQDPSPIETWETEALLAKVRWPFWTLFKKMGSSPDSHSKWRSGMKSGGGTYTPAQFRPPAAKALYGWLGAASVLDPSCGWGDRLAGFYATPGARVYAGCDPNPATWETYQAQCLAYEGWLGSPKHCAVLESLKVSGYPAFRLRGAPSGKDVLIVNGPFEDIDWKLVRDTVAPKGFDLAFTSPPYFGVERYAKGSPLSVNQSWSRYTAFDGWRDNFMMPVFRTCGDVVRPEGGRVIVNIADPIVNKVRHEACDPLVDALVTHGLTYAGVVAMAMMRKPTTNENMGSIDQTGYSEPMWVFTRGRGGALPTLAHVGSLQDVLDGDVESNE